MVDGVTRERANRLGLHGLRVLGYNAGKAAMGEEVAALQGGWFSECHLTYSRETLNKILGMASKMASTAAVSALPRMPLDSEEPILPADSVDPVFTYESAVHTSTSRPAVPASPSAPTQPAPVSERSGAITRVVHKAKSRTYFTFVYDGKSFRSMKQAREACSAEFFSDLRSFGYAVNS